MHLLLDGLHKNQFHKGYLALEKAIDKALALEGLQGAEFGLLVLGRERVENRVFLVAKGTDEAAVLLLCLG